MAKAQCNTVRLKLLKIGAQIRITVSASEAFFLSPFRDTGNLFLSSTVRDFNEFHRPDHVSGRVETSHMVGAVAIEVDKELAFTQVANKTIGEGGFEFFIFSHPLLPDELAVLHDQCPRGTNLIIGVHTRVYTPA